MTQNRRFELSMVLPSDTEGKFSLIVFKSDSESSSLTGDNPSHKVIPVPNSASGSFNKNSFILLNGILS